MPGDIGPAAGAVPDDAEDSLRHPPARVLVVGLNYQPEPTGIAPYTTSLAEGLSEAGAAVHVITTYPHYPQWRILDGYQGRVRHEDVHGVSLTRLRPVLPASGGLLARLRMELVFGLQAALTPWRQPEVALLVTPALFSTALAGWAARLRRVPTCVWVQDIYSLGISETGRGALLGRLMAVLEGRVLRSADRVVVIHERFRRYLVEVLGVEAEKVEVVRNWTHLTPVEVPPREETRRRRGWQPDDVVVLHAGNMGAKQGLENVVHAARLARSRGSQVRFVLLGNGNQRARLEELDEQGDAQFLEPLSDHEFQATLHAADVLLVNERPGLREMAVPSKLTSYFSTGLPVIAATDAGSITAEEMELSGAGPRVDASSPEQLVAAAELLAADPDLSRSYGSAGQAFRDRRLDARQATSAFSAILAATRSGRPEVSTRR